MYTNDLIRDLTSLRIRRICFTIIARLTSRLDVTDNLKKKKKNFATQMLHRDVMKGQSRNAIVGPCVVPIIVHRSSALGGNCKGEVCNCS